jgi:hypothetical protein
MTDRCTVRHDLDIRVRQPLFLSEVGLKPEDFVSTGSSRILAPYFVLVHPQFVAL